MRAAQWSGGGHSPSFHSPSNPVYPPPSSSFAHSSSHKVAELRRPGGMAESLVAGAEPAL